MTKIIWKTNEYGNPYISNYRQTKTMKPRMITRGKYIATVGGGLTPGYSTKTKEGMVSAKSDLYIRKRLFKKR